MTANTPQRVDVERLNELLAKATPGPLSLAQNTNVCWEVRFPNGRENFYIHNEANAKLFVEGITALPALLQQVAASEQRIMTLRETADRATARADDAESKLAEQAAEIERLTEIARKNHDGFEEYERRYYLEQNRAEDAERARDEARAEISDIAAAIPCPHYMDPPDGGDVSVAEQVWRMADDASRWRALRDANEDRDPSLRAWTKLYEDIGGPYVSDYLDRSADTYIAFLAANGGSDDR